MKKIFIFTGFLLSTYTMTAQTPEQKLVQQAIFGMFDGLSAPDIQMIKKHTTADFTVLENGIIWNMDTIAAKVGQLKTLSTYHRENHFDFIKTEIKGNTAWVAYHNAASVVMNEKKLTKQWMESAFLVKETGVWKIQLLHSTVVANAEDHP